MKTWKKCRIEVNKGEEAQIPDKIAEFLNERGIGAGEWQQLPSYRDEQQSGSFRLDVLIVRPERVEVFLLCYM